MSKPAAAEELITKKYNKRSRFGELYYRITRNRGATVGLIIIGFVLVVFVLSVLFVSYESMTAISATARLVPPSGEYPFGTDNLGRNIFLRVVYGIRYSIPIGFGVTVVGLVCGVSLGSLAGYCGGVVESFIMRISEIMTSIPSILFTMVMMLTFGRSLGIMILAMGINAIPAYIRISRASVMSIRGDEYVEAAKATGISNFRIIYTEVLPNAMAPVIITVTTGIGIYIMNAAALSYLGFGVEAPLPEWGGLVSSGRAMLRTAPWVTTFPGMAIMLVVLSFNMLGDGLRDALDPKLKR